MASLLPKINTLDGHDLPKGRIFAPTSYANSSDLLVQDQLSFSVPRETPSPKKDESTRLQNILDSIIAIQGKGNKTQLQKVNRAVTVK